MISGQDESLGGLKSPLPQAKAWGCHTGIEAFIIDACVDI